MSALAVRDDRSADLRQIHALQRQLGMSTEDAQALKLTLTGVASSGDMSGPQRGKLLAHLRRLAGVRGMAAKPRSAGRSRLQKWAPKQKLIWSLWQQLADAGKIEDRGAGPLNAYVKRQTGVDQLAWLNPKQTDLVIESLKKWLGRA